MDPVVAAKPRPLTPHVAASADERRFPCSVAVAAGVEVSKNLRVAQRPCRGDAVALRCADSDAAIRALLERYPAARDIEIIGAGLEEAFLELTSEGADRRAPA